MKLLLILLVSISLNAKGVECNDYFERAVANYNIVYDVDSNLSTIEFAANLSILNYIAYDHCVQLQEFCNFEKAKMTLRKLK